MWWLRAIEIVFTLVGRIGPAAYMGVVEVTRDLSWSRNSRFQRESPQMATPILHSRFSTGISVCIPIVSNMDLIRSGFCDPRPPGRNAGLCS